MASGTERVPAKSDLVVSLCDRYLRVVGRWGMVVGRWGMVVRRGSSMVLAGFVVAVLLAAGADGAKLPGKQLPRSIPYTVAVQFIAIYEFDWQDPGQQLKERKRSAVMAKSRPFFLVRSGTAAKPLYTIASAGGTPDWLTFSGLLDFAGSMRLESVPYRAAFDWSENTYTISGDTSAEIAISLVKNRLRELSVSAQPTVTVHHREASGSWQYTDNKQLDLSPGNPSRAALATRFGAIPASQVKFGRPFTITKKEDVNVNPALQQPRWARNTPAFWAYYWTLRFVPVKAR